jgi:hypothetical protein
MNLIYYRTLFVGTIQNRQIHRSRKQLADASTLGGGGREMGMTVDSWGISFGKGENGLY